MVLSTCISSSSRVPGWGWIDFPVTKCILFVVGLVLHLVTNNQTMQAGVWRAWDLNCTVIAHSLICHIEIEIFLICNFLIFDHFRFCNRPNIVCGRIWLNAASSTDAPLWLEAKTSIASEDWARCTFIRSKRELVKFESVELGQWTIIQFWRYSCATLKLFLGEENNACGEDWTIRWKCPQGWELDAHLEKNTFPCARTSQLLKRRNWTYYDIKWRKTRGDLCLVQCWDDARRRGLMMGANKQGHLI